MSNPIADYALAAEDLSVAELLGGRFAFELPSFQRPYAWQAQDAEHLVDDIEAAMADARVQPNRPPYFLGTMLFAAGGPHAPVRAAMVVDGQQRLTTLTILLAVLRDYADTPEAAAALHRHIAVFSSVDEALADAFHLKLRPQDQRFMALGIQKAGGTRRTRRQATLSAHSDSQNNIEAVRKLFQKRFGKERTAQERQAVAQFVLHNCRVLTMRTADLDYAYQIFLTINGRGQPLSDDDIVIAEVIGPLSQDQRARYASIVAQVDRYREKAERQKLRAKTFFSHLVAIQGWSRQSMIQDLRRAVQKRGGAATFTSDVFQPLAEAYLLTRCDFEAVPAPGALATYLKKLLLLEFICDDEWVGVAMQALSRLPLDSVELVHFLARLDRFAHAQLVLRSTRDERRKRYRAISKTIETDGLQDPELLFALSEAEQERLLRRCAFALNETVNRTDKAILIRLELELSGVAPETYLEMFDPERADGPAVTVEHVLPRGQKLPKGSPWRDLYPDYEHRRVLANAMGNLVLLSETQNRLAGQKSFAEKQAVFFEGDQPHVFVTTEMLRDTENWTPAALRGRHDRLMTKLMAVFDWEGTVPELPLHPGTAPAKKGRRTVKRRAKRRS